jgi:hypothetical protein
MPGKGKRIFYDGTAPGRPNRERFGWRSITRQWERANIMNTHPLRSAAAAAAMAAILGSTAAGFADTVGSGHFDGEVSHVSSNNIKVINPKTHESLSFLLVPHFKQVFSRDGKTVQAASLHEGQYVKVYYDQKFLGQRHADRIYILRNNMMKPGRER